MLRNMSPSFLRQAASAALISSSLLAGCAYGEMPQVLRAQVASEANCPDLVVSQAPSFTPGYKENQYKVRGCGIDRVYTCNGESGGLVKFGSADCSYVASGTPPQPAAGAPTTPAPGTEPDTEPGLDVEDDGNG